MVSNHEKVFYLLEPHEIELLETIRRLAERGISHGIDQKNSDLLDFSSHLLDLINQINIKRKTKNE
jgi:hypothetical protein